ncbi:MAG: gamma-glutamyl-gamma-aminobutyrate hydrolase family protein [Crocinitomicaceae bacterium]|nr:gamma-glutamyl-gamma-aminobutyrate hydrolase family protein [Crocinitomicaceae bacterium]
MILVIDCGSNKTKYIEQIVDEFLDVKSCALFDFKLDDLIDAKGVIISGAPILVTDVDPQPYLDKLNWIKSSNIPVLGICFGHQIMGLLHGSFSQKMNPVRDWEEIGSFEKSPLLNRLPLDFEMMEDHCETISIPPGFTLVASSDGCVNEIMQNKEETLFGVQFHPEVSGNYGRILIENFVHICSPPQHYH